jgi:hypothetical protein
MARLSVLLPEVLFFTIVGSVLAQDADRVIPATQPNENSGDNGRIFWIIPNYKTAALPQPYTPLSAGTKFKLATQDAVDPGTFVLAGLFAGMGQLRNSEPTFGQGAKGYAHYFVTSYADWAGADYMVGAIYPVLLHQDPRYFRKGTGSGFSRLMYAMGQIFWTRTDSGGHMFNFSEIGGNATMVAISQAYYPDRRTAGSAAGSLAIQVGDDMASNILKEFYPDLRRKFLRKH